ncbi:MAG: patatin-like phospholipase family protein [Planctomycetes bacterium]|nr:patatin-like phospholipase family protein [Planctomycetota bacterium]
MATTRPSVRLPLLLLFALLLPAACGWPHRAATRSGPPGTLVPLPGFEAVRAIDGYPSDAFQRAFDEAVAKFAATPLPADGRRDFDMLVLSSGGANGAFGAGVLTGWTRCGNRPDFRVVTGVSVGALMAPFVFAGPAFDDRLEQLFARIEPGDLHREKGIVASVLFDESLMDNSPLRRAIEHGIDDELLAAVAARHDEGRRCWVGSTNLDAGEFVVWDLGAIAKIGTAEARELFCKVLTASASIPVVYPPVRFEHGGDGELHVDGAVIRPLFIPQNVFDGYLSAERVGMNWDDVDATMYVVHNGSLRPCPVDVQRDTLDIATRTVTMMSYTMIKEHVLHLFMLSRAWGAEFRFITLKDGLEVPIDTFTPEQTYRLFLLGQGKIEEQTPWEESPPDYLFRKDLERIAPVGPDPAAAATATAATRDREILDRLERIEAELRELRAGAGSGASVGK